MNKFIINDQYSIEKKIGKGSFGEVFIGKDQNNGHLVGIKLEHDEQKHILKHEYEVYQGISKSESASKPRVPKIYWFGNYKSYRVLVMEYLGNSLDFLFNYHCRGKFSPKTTIMLGIQILDQLSSLHSCGYIHRDIKPENFLMGFGATNKLVYMIDLGLAKEYKRKAHIKEINGKNLVGTARYASINSHKGIELSRRDDLESLGYLLIYFLKGELPWQGIKADTKHDKYRLIGQKKQEVSLEDLCANCPSVILDYMKHVKSLNFKERPNYKYLRSLLTDWFTEQCFIYDYFDWELN